MAEIDEIIKKHFRSSGEAQKALGVTRQTFHYWRKSGIPDLRRYQIDAVIKNSVAVADAGTPQQETALPPP